MKRAPLIAIVLVAAAVPAQASAASFVIRGDEKIGTFAVKADGSLRGAITAFGQPGRLRRQGESCVATWGSYGLTIFFYNLGGADPCKPRDGRFSKAIMAGERWRTGKGLRIGKPARLIPRYYPRATFHRGLRHNWPSGWWLVTRKTPFGLGGQYPGLLAETRRGVVFTFQVRYPAGGE